MNLQRKPYPLSDPSQLRTFIKADQNPSCKDPKPTLQSERRNARGERERERAHRNSLSNQFSCSTYTWQPVRVTTLAQATDSFPVTETTTLPSPTTRHSKWTNPISTTRSAPTRPSSASPHWVHASQRSPPRSLRGPNRSTATSPAVLLPRCR